MERYIECAVIGIESSGKKFWKIKEDFKDIEVQCDVMQDITMEMLSSMGDPRFDDMKEFLEFVAMVRQRILDLTIRFYEIKIDHEVQMFFAGPIDDGQYAVMCWVNLKMIDLRPDALPKSMNPNEEKINAGPKATV